MRPTAWILVAGIAVLAIGARANPRSPPDRAAAPEVETPDLADWMKRLQGRFLFDGSIYFVSTELQRGAAEHPW